MDQRPVVLVCLAGRSSATALSRAASLAGRVGAPLHVLEVTPEDGLVTERSTRRRWLEHLGARTAASRRCQASGSLVNEAIDYAHAHDARMIVVPSPEGMSGSCVTAIATAARAPVLVAHPPTGGDAVVAATDLHDATYPVLQQAADMIDHAEAALVGLHSVDAAADSAEVAQCVTALAVALEPLALTPEAVVDSGTDPADAVLATARARNADLIVVGAPPRTWIDSMLRPCVAARVVASARRSVLVMPVLGHAVPG